MPPPNGEYDQNLLDEAPKATRAQRQEGYNVDLLDERPARRSPSMRSPSTPAPNALPVTPGVAESGSREKFAPGAPNSVYTPAPRKSFWKTRNGIITLAVITLVILGAVIGGAVGGTMGAKKNNNVVSGGTTGSQSDVPNASSSIPLSSSSTATSSQAQQGVGQGSGGSIGGAVPTSTAFGPAEFRPSTTSAPLPEQTASTENIVGIAVDSN
ncbi:hypothetical protein F5I97DRAFT_312170 [Phlebopus sp. FC_14]|nr:hypothetical protein F5I97DRAFT_312170 [Phlebopus sp. FC_14]